ncbi:MAG: hypothetical protein HY445_01665 [Candidatus Niyogibacteria bacterium]|nr:hypothetical protein [Candidatus Niyogibacteria bacterium]
MKETFSLPENKKTQSRENIKVEELEFLEDDFERSPAAFGLEKIEQIDEAADLSVHEGLRAMKQYRENARANFSARELDAVLGKDWDLAFGEQLAELHEKIASFTSRAKESILSILIKTKTEKPPIVPGEVFNPYSARHSILTAPTKERREKLKEFKEKLAYQKIGLAVMQEKIVEEIRSHPDESSQTLSQYAQAFEKQYGFTSDQIELIEQMIETYASAHQQVKDVRKKFPNDSDLFQAMFKVQPKGNIEVIEGPLTLYFRCHDLEDYTIIYSGVWRRSRGITDLDIQEANSTGGVSIGRVPVNGQSCFVIAEKAEGQSFQDAQSILAHEEQHAIKQLFDDNEFDFDQSRPQWAKMIEAVENNDEDREFWIKQCLRDDRHFLERYAKDEILAFMKQENNFDSDYPQLVNQGIYNVLTRPVSRGGIYDYFGDPRFGDIKNRNIDAVVRGVGEELRPEVERMAKEVFESEYHAIIKNSLDAYMTLKEKGFTLEQITAILLKEPLSKWQRVVDRIVSSGISPASRK